jgi:hypothetical protein
VLALVAIVVAARAVGMVFARIHQPPVMGEVAAGILLGPSFLGYVEPGISGQLFPGAINPMLSVIAQIGVILYMFIVHRGFLDRIGSARGGRSGYLDEHAWADGVDRAQCWARTRRAFAHAFHDVRSHGCRDHAGHDSYPAGADSECHHVVNQRVGKLVNGIGLV